MMRADEGFQSDQAGGRLASFHQWHATIMPILQSAVSNLIRTTDGETHSEPLASNGNIAIRHFEYRAEKWRSVTLDCQSNFHRRTPLLSV